MFSNDFMKFLISYSSEEKNEPKAQTKEENNYITPVKVKEAARVVIASIKDVI